MKQAHTSGPWTFTGSINNTKTRVTYYIGKPTTTGSATDHCVEPVGLASNSRLSLSNEECLANARLMSAAPEMLAALKGAQSALRKALPLIECPDDLTHNGTQTYCGEWLDEITEVISKATEASA